MFNKDFARLNQEFIAACVKGDVKATQRQASKYRRHYGTAWKNRVNVPAETQKPDCVHLHAEQRI